MMTTPIFTYFKRNSDKLTLQGNKLSIDEESKKTFFGDIPLKFVEDVEYFEFFQLLFVPGM